MTSFFTLTLDTIPPAVKSLSINGGVGQTADSTVLVEAQTKSLDVASMKVWGGVDVNADDLIQAEEGDSEWIDYTSQVGVVLSSGAGPKTIYVRLRDDVGNQSIAYRAAITLVVGVPTVTLLAGVATSRISKVTPGNLTSFTWTADVDFDEYVVRLVRNIGALRTAGVAIPSSATSLNVAGMSGPYLANAPIVTQIDGVDVSSVSPGDTSKIIKVFVRAGSVWSL